MKLKFENEIRNEIINSSNVPEEIILRDFISQVIREIKIEDLKKIFNIKIIYGFNKQLEEAYKKDDEYLIEEIKHLINQNKSRITGSIHI